jgi:molybdate transport system permease protein
MPWWIPALVFGSAVAFALRRHVLPSWFLEVSWEPLWLSLEVAAIAMAVSLVIGTGLALLLQWRALPAPDVFDAVISAPLVLPPTVLGYYLFTALGVFGTTFIFNFKGAVIAATVGSLPLVVRAVRIGLEAVDPNLIAAARTLGAPPLRRLVTVTLPLAGPGIAAAAMLGFARALGDYGITQVVASTHFTGIGIPVTSPASIFMYDQFIGGHDEAARAMAIVTTILGVSILFVANRLTRRLHHHRG